MILFQTKGPVGESLREKQEGEHKKLVFGNEAINVYAVTHTGDTCGFMGCEHAFKEGNTCRLTLCYDCCDVLKAEHQVKSFKPERGYKFQGCKNHSYKDLVESYDGEGAHWCTSDKKRNSENDPRPYGCVNCLRPFVFCGRKKRK